jgi:hypothetical protein
LLGYGNDALHWKASPVGGTPGLAGSYCPSAIPIALSVSPSEAWLSIPTLPGETFIIEYTDSLAPPSWQLLQQVTGGATNVIEVMDAAGEMRRYYRAHWSE